MIWPWDLQLNYTTTSNDNSKPKMQMVTCEMEGSERYGHHPRMLISVVTVDPQNTRRKVEPSCFIFVASVPPRPYVFLCLD